MGGRRRTLLGLVVVLGSALDARAEDDSTHCPLDHAPLPLLNFQVGEQTGLRLDLRPLGDGGVLTPLTRCPSCGLVSEGVPHQKEDLPRLRTVLGEPAVQAAKGQRSNRFLRATTLQALHASAEVRARAWLEAAWELEGIDEPRRRASLEQALNAYAEVELIPQPPDLVARAFGESKEDLPRTAGLLQVELLRQLGRFGVAQTKLESLARRPEFQRGLYRYLVPNERELLTKHDQRPQPIAHVPPIDPREDDPEHVYARTMPGWERFSRAFELLRVDRGNINFEVESQRSDSRSTTPRLIDTIWWFNPLNDEKQPSLTWNDLLDAHQRAELAAAKHPWLQRWKAADPSHSLELHLVGSRHWTTDGDREVVPLWRDSGLKGPPSFELLLCWSRSSSARVFIDEQGAGSVIISTSGTPGSSHWLDGLRFKFDREYGVVTAQGDLQVRSVPPKAAASP